MQGVGFRPFVFLWARKHSLNGRVTNTASGVLIEIEGHATSYHRTAEKKSEFGISQAVARGLNTLGFMLPYSPLHHLLLHELNRPLVMTSGNISDEPIFLRTKNV